MIKGDKNRDIKGSKAMSESKLKLEDGKAEKTIRSEKSPRRVKGHCKPTSKRSTSIQQWKEGINQRLKPNLRHINRAQRSIKATKAKTQAIPMKLKPETQKNLTITSLKRAKS
ncbi:unnamed protein product [Arabis nemorensis]|uniref:Uncharacterized protein n=1 Tax=Arabis nemorensis TaxID=586526 RepID=A0A565CPZ7_9BRAS|nr:unnamed protein product [Arabis nemorensis]